ncbi:hypothetical protein BDQ17DRAFT_1434791 [Cyathus striatus]|nr:hypothetical protein BDQ17DRAFT_1434791 [Cyathus striatus]
MALKCTECSIPADLILRSHEGTIFHAHSDALSSFAQGFPPASITPQNGEIFAHMAQEQPDLKKVSIECLVGVAEAVEKYMMYPAMQACSLRMEMVIGDYPLEVLGYAPMFAYEELSNKAAPLTMHMSAEVASKKLDLRTFRAWAIFKEKWKGNIRRAIYEPPELIHFHTDYDRDNCQWVSFAHTVTHQCYEKSVENWRSVITEFLHMLSQCSKCQNMGKLWEQWIMDAETDTGMFTTYL